MTSTDASTNPPGDGLPVDVDAGNFAFVAEFPASGLGDLASRPRRRVAVVACMDVRLPPLESLGLDHGDAHVIRNAGGVLTDDVIRSVCISQRALGTREILLLHHTDCGLAGLDAGGFLDALEADTGRRPSWDVGAFADAHDDTRRAMAELRDSPFIEHEDRIRGFVYDVDTGRLDEVDPAG